MKGKMVKIRQLIGSVFWKIALSLTTPPTKAEPSWLQVKAGLLQGTELFVDVRDGASREMIEGIYDSFIYDALGNIGILKDSISIWDIGAHIGYHTLAFAALVGSSGCIYAFEPNPYNMERLRQHLEKNQPLATRIKLMDCALSNLDDQLPFRFSPLYFLSSIGYLDTTGTYPSERISKSTYNKLETTMVPVRKADSLIKEGLPPPALIKIDVEGAEVQVLEGAQDLLSTHRPALIIEIHNIKNMFLIQEILLNLDYKSRFLDAQQQSSSSRGFILAI